MVGEATTQTIPAGMVAVPVDLTFHPAMREAGWRHVDTRLFHGLETQMQAMWSAMLAAAPNHEGPQCVEVERLREALSAEDDYWAASRALASAFARTRPQAQAVFDAATRRRDIARAALNAPAGTIKNRETL